MIVSEVQESLALALFDVGAVKINVDEGFLLADGTVSPVYFNIRTPDHPEKPGPLTPELVARIGQQLYGLMYLHQLPGKAVAGVPKAGEPLADALAAVCPTRLPVVRLGKEERHRMYVTDHAGCGAGDNVTLADDVIKSAGSKMRAILALRREEFVVTDVLVLIDREQGGREQLQAARCRFHAVFTARDLLFLYLRRALVSQSDYDAVIAYLEGDLYWQFTAIGGFS